ncbi:MAG: hypothetical protein FWG79_08225 [Bacteroidales bacterium]|nr:hypothetical protein [Bacteroidales bacterium]
MQEIRRRYALTFPAITYSSLCSSWFFTLRRIAVMSTGATIPVMSTGARKACGAETSPCY